jgi:hypothetical protein
MASAGSNGTSTGRQPAGIAMTGLGAKAPPGITPDPQRNAQATNLLHTMLRSLLIERFKMAARYEDRPMDAWTRVAAKPKLANAIIALRCCHRNGRFEDYWEARRAA